MRAVTIHIPHVQNPVATAGADRKLTPLSSRCHKPRQASSARTMAR